jgi:hypothetical protein
MKSFYTFLPFVFLFFSALQGQENPDSIKNLLANSLQEISFSLLSQHYDNEVIATDFDFYSWQPINEINNPGLFYKCYYTNDTLVALSVFDKTYNKLNYDFGIHYSDKKIFMVSKHWETHERTGKNYNIYGFFMIDTLKKRAFFYGPVYFGDEPDHAIQSLRNIYLLNKHLKATHKLVFISQLLYYQTVYDYSMKKVNEKLWQYLWHPNIPLRSCGKYKKLSKLTITDLMRLFENPELCPHQTVGTAIPGKQYKGESIPFVWDINQYYHKWKD